MCPLRFYFRRRTHAHIHPALPCVIFLPFVLGKLTMHLIHLLSAITLSSSATTPSTNTFCPVRKTRPPFTATATSTASAPAPNTPRPDCRPTLLQLHEVSSPLCLQRYTLSAESRFSPEKWERKEDGGAMRRRGLWRGLMLR